MATLKELNKDFSSLYDRLKKSSDETTFWAYGKLYAGEVEKKHTRGLLLSLCQKLEEVKEMAHKLDEHLAWDLD